MEFQNTDMMGPETMDSADPYPNNVFASEIAKKVVQIDTAEGLQILPVTTVAQLELIKASGLSKDSRISQVDTETTKSVFDGLEFDSELIRSQEFVFVENESPVGVLTFNVAPRSYIESLRYFKKEPDGIRVLSASSITDGENPEFYIIPAWTEVLESHKNSLRIARPGLKAFDAILRSLVEEAPPGTWIESVAQGQAVEIGEGETVRDRYNRVQLIKAWTGKKPGTLMPYAEIPFSLEDFGVNSKGSSATVTNAQRIGLELVPAVAGSVSLGPVFIKKVGP